MQNLGVSAGTAVSAKCNKAWRQGANVASMIGQFTADLSGQDVHDDGNIGTLEANYILALTAHLQLHQFVNSAVFSTPGTTTWTVPAGVFRVKVKVVGAGGGGAGGQGGSTWSGGGGGSGGYAEGFVTVTPGQVIVIVVGAGGLGAAQGNGVTAGTGGSSSFGSYIGCTGGTGGTGGTSTSSGGAPGVGTGASELNMYGANGGDGNIYNAAVQGGQGGSSAYGGGGRTSTVNISASNGLAPGSGGGGIWGTGLGAQNGGTGANGQVTIEWSA